MAKQKRYKNSQLLLYIVLANCLITNFIIWLWFKYSLANEWLFNELKRNLIELLTPLAN